MPTYNKLVRDKIPAIIEKQGLKLSTAILSDEKYIKELKKKAKEELQEYLEAETDEDALEELADLLELIHSLSTVHKGSIEKVEEIRKQKAKKRGGFKEKIFLIEVEDE